MPLLRVRSEKDLKSGKLRKSPKSAQAGFAAASLPAVPPLPARLDHPPQLPLPDFAPSASPSPSSLTASPASAARSVHRRSRSIGADTADRSPQLQDQPWRTREAWQALHSHPSSPPALPLPLPGAGSSGWRVRGGGTFFGGGVGDEAGSVRSEGMRRVRTETRRRAGTSPLSQEESGETVEERGSVTRSHTDGDLSALATESRRPSDDVLGSIIDDYSPLSPATWTTGTAGALYRKKTVAAVRTTSPTTQWDETPSSPPAVRQSQVSAGAGTGHTPHSSVDSQYPPTMVSDRSTIASTDESTLLVTTESSSATPTPPRGSVDVPTSPSQSPWLGSSPTLPALLPPSRPLPLAGEGGRKGSFTDPPQHQSPVPWGRKSPSHSARKGRPRSHTSPSMPSSVPQTPLTPPDMYTAADVPHTPSPPQITAEWLHAATRTPITPITQGRPPISARGSSVRPFLHSQPKALVHPNPIIPIPGTGGPRLGPPAPIVSRSKSRPTFRDALPPPPIPDRASSAPRGAGAASPLRPNKSPKRTPVGMVKRGIRRVDSYGSGWSKESGFSATSAASAASAGSGSTGESRNSRGGWI